MTAKRKTTAAVETAPVVAAPSKAKLAQRIGEDMRNTIVMKLLAQLPSADYKPMEKEHAVLAEKVRVYGMSDSEKRLFNKLPKGWLEENRCVEVSVGGMRHTLIFSGDMSNHVPYNQRFSYSSRGATGAGYTSPNTVSKHVRHKTDNDYGRLNLLADSELGLAITAFFEKAEKHNNTVAELKRKAWAVLAECKTVRQLLDLWPELEPFVPEPAMPDMPSLPAVRREELNAAFNLPTT